MGEEHVAAATLFPETTMYPYMEAPAPAYPPEYDHPEATQQEVLDVVFGRIDADGLGRDYDDLMGESPMMSYAELLADDGDAERDLMVFLGQHWGDVPGSVKAVFEALADSAAKQDRAWRRV